MCDLSLMDLFGKSKFGRSFSLLIKLVVLMHVGSPTCGIGSHLTDYSVVLCLKTQKEVTMPLSS